MLERPNPNRLNWERILNFANFDPNLHPGATIKHFTLAAGQLDEPLSPHTAVGLFYPAIVEDQQLSCVMVSKLKDKRQIITYYNTILLNLKMPNGNGDVEDDPIRRIQMIDYCRQNCFPIIAIVFSNYIFVSEIDNKRHIDLSRYTRELHVVDGISAPTAIQKLQEGAREKLNSFN